MAQYPMLFLLEKHPTESVNTVFNKYTAGIIKQQTTIMKQMRIYHYTTRAMCYKTVVFFLDN